MPRAHDPLQNWNKPWLSQQSKTDNSRDKRFRVPIYSGNDTPFEAVEAVRPLLGPISPHNADQVVKTGKSIREYDMKRRTFLRMLGLAPVAVAVPAIALPRPDNVKETVKGSVTMGEQVGEYANIRVYIDPAQGTKRVVISADAFDITGLNRDLEAHFKNAAAHHRYLVSEAGRIANG